MEVDTIQVCSFSPGNMVATIRQARIPQATWEDMQVAKDEYEARAKQKEEELAAKKAQQGLLAGAWEQKNPFLGSWPYPGGRMDGCALLVCVAVASFTVNWTPLAVRRPLGLDANTSSWCSTRRNAARVSCGMRRRRFLFVEAAAMPFGVRLSGTARRVRSFLLLMSLKL